MLNEDMPRAKKRMPYKREEIKERFKALTINLKRFDEHEAFTRQELSLFLGVSLSLIDKWRKSDNGPPFKVGPSKDRINAVLYPKSTLLLWIKNNAYNVGNKTEL